MEQLSTSVGLTYEIAGAKYCYFVPVSRGTPGRTGMVAGGIELGARRGRDIIPEGQTGQTSDFTAALRRAIKHGVFTDGLTPEQHRTAKDFITNCGRALQNEGDPEAAQVLSTVALFMGKSRGPMGELAWTAVAALMGAQQRPGVISALCQVLRAHGSSSETGNLALLALTDEYKPTPDREVYARAILSLGKERICEHNGFRDPGSGKVIHRLPIIDALIASPRIGSASAIAAILTVDIGISQSHLEVIARRFIRTCTEQAPRDENLRALELIGRKGLTPQVRELARQARTSQRETHEASVSAWERFKSQIVEGFSIARENLANGTLTLKGLFRFA